MTCPACGRILDIGVCMGPHRGYRLRNSLTAYTGRYLDLPDWWPNPDARAITQVDDDTREGVTESGVTWRIRYDPAERLREQAAAERAAQRETERMRARADELDTMLRLAAKYGYVVRPSTVRVAEAVR